MMNKKEMKQLLKPYKQVYGGKCHVCHKKRKITAFAQNEDGIMLWVTFMCLCGRSRVGGGGLH